MGKTLTLTGTLLAVLFSTGCMSDSYGGASWRDHYEYGRQMESYNRHGGANSGLLPPLLPMSGSHGGASWRNYYEYGRQMESYNRHGGANSGLLPPLFPGFK